MCLQRICVKSVPRCSVVYEERKKNEVKSPHFKLPSVKDEKDLGKKGIDTLFKAIREFQVTETTYVCKKHWPNNYPTYRRFGHERPLNPPSVFNSISNQESMFLAIDDNQATESVIHEDVTFDQLKQEYSSR